MYKIFGWINVALVVIITAPYIVRKLNQWWFHIKSPGYFKLMHFLRRLHKPSAVLLLISIAVHAWLVFGSFRWHTGTLAGIAFYVTALTGLTFYLSKKWAVLKIHRALALTAVLLMLVHLLVPNLLYTLGMTYNKINFNGK